MAFDPKYADIYRENGRRMAEIKRLGVEYAKTHFDMGEIDAYIDHLIHEAGGEPAFKKVRGYHHATCISVNDCMVHGIPKGTLKPGDIVNIDSGMFWQGTTTDTSTTFVIGEATTDQKRFLKVGQDTLNRAIKEATPGHTVWHISNCIQKHIEAEGYNVTRQLTGHGVGRTMHEAPPIPCFVSDDPDLKTRIVPGMVLAIEVMYMKGDWPMYTGKDGWGMYTKDGGDTAVFEEDVLITPNGNEVLTKISYD